MIEERQAWMKLLAHAQWAELRPLVQNFTPPQGVEFLREPECGMVLVKARAGGSGNEFHVGEASVTRCVIRLATGEMGFAYKIAGEADHVRISAILDGLLQGPQRQQIQADILTPLEAIITNRKQTESRQVAATQVEFFTLVRGEDA